MAGLRSIVALALVGAIAVAVGLSLENAIWLPGMIAVVISPMVWGVREYRARSSDGQADLRTWKSVAGYVIEMLASGVYIVLASLVLLFALSYHAEGARLALAVSLFALHLAGGVALLTWSIRKWLDGSRAGYWVALLVLGLTGLVAVAGAAVGRALPGTPGM